MIVLLTFVSLIPFKLVNYFKQNKDTEKSLELESLNNIVKPSSLEHITKLHLNPSVKPLERKLESNIFFDKEKARLKTEAEVIISMKNKIEDPLVCKNILEDVRPGILQRIMPERVEKISSYLKNIKVLRQVWKILDRTKIITFFYIDQWKDLLFALRLLTLIGGTFTLGMLYVAKNPTTFSSQVIIISLTSALLPVILSAFIIASNPLIVTGFHYQNKLRNISKWKLFLLRVLSFFFFPLIPALLFDVKEREKENLSKLLLVSDHTNPAIKDEIMRRRKFLISVREGFKINRYTSAISY